MKEIGEYLKNRRLEAGISLDDAEQELKIRKKYLIAIEEGNENVLPGRTYFLGYLRNYANYLEADQATIDQLLAKNEPVPQKIESPTPVRRKRSGRYFSPEKRKYRVKHEKEPVNYLPLIKIAMIVILLGAVIFLLSQFVIRINQSPVPVTQNEEIADETNMIEEQKTLEQELTEMAELNMQQEEITATPVEPYLEPLPDYKPIEITTQEPAWIKVVQDDHVLFESVILSEEEISIKTEGAVSLLTTVASDIQVSYDGQTINPQPSDNYRIVRYEILSSNENS